MMSFRTAIDATLIAQLVGRMVRTPLARRVDANELLNTVALYLPHYNEQGLTSVINRLTAPDADIMPPVTVERGEDVIALTRASDSAAMFAALSTLPSYVIPRSRKTSEVRRLMKLSRLLAHDDIDEEAPDIAVDELLDVLRTAYDHVKGSKQFKTIVEEKGKIEVRAVNWQIGTDVADESETIRVDIASENVDDLFDAVGRKLGEGLHKAWWRSLHHPITSPWMRPGSPGSKVPLSSCIRC
jgi:type III restriction enzyme